MESLYSELYPKSSCWGVKIPEIQGWVHDRDCTFTRQHQRMTSTVGKIVSVLLLHIFKINEWSLPMQCNVLYWILSLCCICSSCTETIYLTNKVGATLWFDYIVPELLAGMMQCSTVGLHSSDMIVDTSYISAVVNSIISQRRGIQVSSPWCVKAWLFKMASNRQTTQLFH